MNLSLLFTILIVIGTSFHSCKGCPNSWIAFEGMCYSFNTTKMNWFHAAHACREQNGWLVDIQTKTVNDFVKSTINRLHAHDDAEHVGYWTGGNDLDVERQFVWGYPGSQSPVTYTDWFQGEPNNNWNNRREEDCIVLWGRSQYGYQWNDQPCENVDYFICKTGDASTAVVG
ncbi:hypothetical protein ACF0H5_009212 [Mactra antiquata]